MKDPQAASLVPSIAAPVRSRAWQATALAAACALTAILAVLWTTEVEGTPTTYSWLAIGTALVAFLAFYAARERSFVITQQDLSTRLEGLIDSCPLPIICLDTNYQLTAWSSAAERTFGYTAEEVLGRTYPLVPPEGWPEFEKLTRRIFIDGEHISGINVRRRHKDGRILDIVLSGAPLRDRRNRIVGSVYILQDVTQQNRAAEILRRSEERFRLIVDNVKEYAIFMLNSTGTVTTWNSGAERINGYTAEEIIGQPFAIFHTPEDREQNLPLLLLEQTLENGRLEERGWRVRKDGSLFFANVAITAVNDTRQGKLIGYAIVMRDISDRKKADEASAVIKRIFENSQDLILVVDRQGTFIEVSPSSKMLLGYEPDEMVGRSATEFLYSVDLEDTRQEMRNARRERHVSEFDTRYVHKDGRVVTLSWKGIWSEAEQRHYFIGRDMTQQRLAAETIRRMNEDLENRIEERTVDLIATNRELEAFSYSVSHDLRAPLRAINGFSRILLEEYGALLPAEGQQYLQSVRNNSQQMGRLIDDLLAFSRLGRQALKTERVDIGNLVREVMADLRREDERRDIDVSVGNLGTVHVDPALFRQVLVNLLSNAIKFTRKVGEPKIEIGIEDTPQGRAFYVRDNGAGFDMKYADKLFSVFQRLHRMEDYEGTGVGLAIVQRVIHRHGGQVWADARLNEGATFYFTLPGTTSHDPIP
jgi:PAS domain S-box-containing protein